jgi:phosphate-selective porin OprO and OprP
MSKPITIMLFVISSFALKAQHDTVKIALPAGPGVVGKTDRKIPFYSFNNGLGFATPDSSYSINIRFRMQNRALMTTVSDEDFSPAGFEFRVRRCRLSFTGHVYNPKWSYYLQLSFSRGDMDWSVTDVTTQNVSPNVVRDAMVFYRPVKNLQLGFGQTKLPGNRQRVVSSSSLQFYDRSPVNSNLTLDRDFGAFVNYTIRAGQFKTIIKTAVSSGEGRNSNLSNPGLAYTGRLELLPLGDFTEGGDYFEGDVAREEKPKISIAGGYHFNDLAVRSQGQLGRDLYSAKSYHVYLADFLFKYRGIAFSTEYIRRDTDGSPVTRNAAGSTRSLITGDGINTQLSYCFKSRWEIAARHALVTPHKDIYGSFNQINHYGIGVTNYVMKHKVKTQFNIFYMHDRNLAAATDVSKNLLAVFQVELGI